MSEENKQQILNSAISFFQQRIIANHIKNVQKCARLDTFNINPFITAYLAKFAFSDVNAETLAKALIYPRVLGTSITTSFGNQLQKFSTEVLSAYASTTAGMDIEYVDSRTNRHVYCQLKAGPQTINKDDVETICNHFKGIRNLLRVNGSNDFNPSTDCIVGIFYGNRASLSTNYKNIEKEGYTVLIGDEFWTSLTGDPTFYEELIGAMVNGGADASNEVLQQTIRELSNDIREHPDVVPICK